MISNGLVYISLFFLIGVLYSCYYTKLIKYYFSLVYAFIFIFFLFIYYEILNMRMSETNNFISKFLILCRIFNKKKIFTVIILVF